MEVVAAEAPFSVNREFRERERELAARLERLANDVDALQANAQFHQMLVGMARLWRYGYLNQMLIAHQRPSASWVQGPRQWERLGRHVRDGERAIWIAAPSRAHVPWPFYPVRVVDVQQTDGPQLPELGAHYRGDDAVLERVEKAASVLGLTIEEAGELESAAGAQTLGEAHPGGRIRVLRAARTLERCRVLVHEYAHELLHLPQEQSRRLVTLHARAAVLEAEADATAYVVLLGLGIEFNAPSYVAWRRGAGEDIVRSIKRTIAAERVIRAAIDGRKVAVRIPPFALPPVPKRRDVAGLRRLGDKRTAFRPKR